MERSVCDLTSFLHLIGVMFMLMELNAELILAKIVPSPLIRYAHENEHTRLECHNVSQSNEFYNFAKNVRWYRLVNGVHHDIGSSDRVYASGHILFFDSFMSEFDQGQYECCVPQEGCSGPASIILVVDPIAEVVATNYIGFEGHSVVLACKIIYIGMPPAIFYWERHDKKVINRDITTNDTHTLLILTNLTRGDSGEYRCVAEGPLSLDRYSVYLRLQVPPKVMIYGPGSMVQTGTKVQMTCSQLEGKTANISIVTPSNTVIQHSTITFIAIPNNTGNYLCVASVLSINVTASHYLHVYDIDNTTSLISFVVEIHNDYCRHEPKLFERKLRVLLEDEILRICRCNVTVTSSGYQCIGYSRALYNVTITGFMAGNIKDFIEHSQLAPELDLQIATISVCNRSCNGLVSNTNTTHNDSRDDDVDNDDENTTSNNTHNNNVTSILAISMASFAMVLLCLILGVGIQDKANRQDDYILFGVFLFITRKVSTNKNRFSNMPG
ncbi:titin-like [Dysidea avara]|uniref:titin-like n=1 Tax=Dysidea avara TaxID=196820 RepID=UPI00331B0D02